MEYIEKTYRRRCSSTNLSSYQVKVRETDLFISSDIDLAHVALDCVHRHRAFLEAYIASHPEFAGALLPLAPDSLAPAIVQDMLAVSRLAGVGPMAAVAGAIAQFVGSELLAFTSNIIVENGGDIYLKCNEEIKIGIFAGASSLSNKLAVLIKPEDTPVGVCTSSGTVGHSLSFGVADAVCVKSRSTSLADAAATAIGNQVKTRKDIKRALNFGAAIDGVLGIMIILDDGLGVWGDMELI